MNKTEARKQFEYVLSGIEAEYQNRIKPHSQWRDQEIENARKLWATLLEHSESEEDFASLGNGVTGKAPISGAVPQGSPQQTHAKTNGSGGSRIPTEVIKKYVSEVMSDPDVETVTQPEIRNRLLRDYPDAKLPSIRSAIANHLAELKDQGKLKLVEEGKAGRPNQFRKIGTGYAEVSIKFEDEELRIEEPDSLDS